jgi:hypothetical protein
MDSHLPLSFYKSAAERLCEARWIDRAVVSQTDLRVRWTDKGRACAAQLLDLLAELEEDGQSLDCETLETIYAICGMNDPRTS